MFDSSARSYRFETCLHCVDFIGGIDEDPRKEEIGVSISNGKEESAVRRMKKRFDSFVRGGGESKWLEDDGKSSSTSFQSRTSGQDPRKLNVKGQLRGEIGSILSELAGRFNSDDKVESKTFAEQKHGEKTDWSELVDRALGIEKGRKISIVSERKANEGKDEAPGWFKSTDSGREEKKSTEKSSATSSESLFRQLWRALPWNRSDDSTVNKAKKEVCRTLLQTLSGSNILCCWLSSFASVSVFDGLSLGLCE